MFDRLRAGCRGTVAAMLAAMLAFGGLPVCAKAEGIEVVAQEEATSNPSLPSLHADAELLGDNNAVEAQSDNGDVTVGEDSVSGTVDQGGAVLEAAASNLIASGTCGTCEWLLDSEGALVVRPIGGASEGLLSNGPNTWWGGPWTGKSDLIRTVKFEGVVHAVTCYEMFVGCSKLTDADLSGLDTATYNALCGGMFSNCDSLRSVTVSQDFTLASELPAGAWESQRTGMVHLPKTIPSGVADTYTLGNWNLSGTCVWRVDEEGTLVVKPAGGASEGTLGGSRWGGGISGRIRATRFEGTVHAPSCGALFAWCNKLTSLDLSGLDISSAKDYSEMFVGCSALKSIDLSGLETSCAASAFDMFSYCTSLESIDLSGWDASGDSVTRMFDSCSSLGRITVGEGFNIANFPYPYGRNDLKWTSKKTGKVYTTEFVRKYRGGIADTYTCTAAANMSRATISPIGWKSYTGSAIKPSVTVKLNGKSLRSGTDYSVSYSDNTDPGMATVTVTGRGTYVGTKTATFEIVKSYFIDSNPNDEANHGREVAWMVTSGISTGWEVSNGYEFRGLKDVTRCDFAAFLYRLADLADNGRRDDSIALSNAKVKSVLATVSDCDARTSHADEVAWLVNSGISKGWTNHGGKTVSFRPMAKVARQDMAAFLYRFADIQDNGAQDESLAMGSEGVVFADVTGGDDANHAAAVEWLASVGITKGWGLNDGSYEFRGTKAVARQDMAAFMYRLNGYLG